MRRIARNRRWKRFSRLFGQLSAPINRIEPLIRRFSAADRRWVIGEQN